MLQFFPILALLLGFAGAADADNHKVQLLDATVCADDLHVQHSLATRRIPLPDRECFRESGPCARSSC